MTVGRFLPAAAAALALCLCALPSSASADAGANADKIAAAFKLAGPFVRSVDVTGDGKLIKHVIAEGKGITPPKGVTVSAHYTGKLASNGDTFDSSVSRGTPFTFPVGGGRVIKGWDLGFASMTKGEKAVLEIASDLGYGARGAGGKIPGGATLWFEVELLSFPGDDAEL